MRRVDRLYALFCRIEKPEANTNAPEGLNILHGHRPRMRRNNGDCLMRKILVARGLCHGPAPIAHLHLERANRRVRNLRERLCIRENLVRQFRPCDGQQIGDPIAIDRNLTNQTQHIVATPSMNRLESRRIGASERKRETILGSCGTVTPGQIAARLEKPEFRHGGQCVPHEITPLVSHSRDRSDGDPISFGAYTPTGWPMSV